ncbi:hypothetical protein E5288_WYG000981 [Bos mutus]|uniref:Uncharacterized protein n=1 Tax=Bos mutus TaxID=72004 RepID=A0A6B0RUS9_9CETA|nr:hypothetical protein [Bos mutus]
MNTGPVSGLFAVEGNEAGRPEGGVRLYLRDAGRVPTGGSRRILSELVKITEFVCVAIETEVGTGPLRMPKSSVPCLVLHRL